MNLILASQSPRRRELLGLFRLPFIVRVADIDETMDLEKAPYDEVARVSRLKAEAIQRGADDVVIAAEPSWSAKTPFWESRTARKRQKVCFVFCPAGIIR